MDDEFIIKGTLQQSALPELLRSVCKSKESGILTCKVDDIEKTIYIDRGNLIFATSSDLDDRLGESLLRYGKITIRNFLNATKLVDGDKRLGSVLCEQAAITPEELVEGVRAQVKDIIISLFNVKRGPYELVLKPINTEEMVLLNASTEDIIYEGIKTITSWSRISKGIGSYAGRLVPTPDADRILMNLSLLSSDESHLLSLCSTRRFSVEEICNMSYSRNFETCRALWGFMMVGVLEVLEQTERPELDLSVSPEDAESDLHDLVENYNDVYSYIYDYAFRKLGDATADELAGKAMLKVQQTMPGVARDLKLDTYGRLDFDAILKNLHPVPPDGRMKLVAGALEEITYSLLSQVGSYFGASDQAFLTKEVEKIRKM